MKRPVPLVILFAWAGLSFAPVYFVQMMGFESISFHAPDRNPDGSVSLDIYLHYGGNFEPGKWIELLLGVPVIPDNTVYLGLNCIPFMVLGLVRSPRKAVPFVCTAVLIALLSCAAFPASLVYYWPKMNYFRHLGMIGSVARIFLTILAGIGVDQLCRKDTFPSRKLLLSIAVLMIGIAAFYSYLAGDVFHRFPAAVFEPLRIHTAYPELSVSGHVRFEFVVVWASVFFWLTLALTQQRFLKHLAVLLVAVLIADLGIYKYRFVEFKTEPLTAAAYDALFFTAMPFQERRANPVERDPESFRRMIAIFESQRYVRDRLLDNNPRRELTDPSENYRDGAAYGTNNAFLFFDELGASYRVQLWQKPFNDYFIGYWTRGGKDMKDVLKFTPYRDYYGILFPFRHPAAFKISGSTEDKIQFFSTAILGAGHRQIESMITDNSYAGDVIVVQLPSERSPNDDCESAKFADKDLAPAFLGASSAGLLASALVDGPFLTASALVTGGAKDFPLNGNARLHLAYQVSRFDSNHLEVVVDNDSGQPIWMLYSDVAHPWWQATVNGKPTCIFTANLAYKAVLLVPGRNVVHFRCRSETVSWLFVIVGLFSMFWTLAVLYAMVAFMVGRAGMQKV
jgi:hypothetical protein